MVSELIGGYNNLKVAMEALLTLREFKKDTEAALKINEVITLLNTTQATIFDIQNTNLKLQQEIIELKEKLKQKNEKENYELITIGNSKIYKHKVTGNVVCTVCFESGRISTLQDERGGYHCRKCLNFYDKN